MEQREEYRVIELTPFDETRWTAECRTVIDGVFESEWVPVGKDAIHDVFPTQEEAFDYATEWKNKSKQRPLLEEGLRRAESSAIYLR